MDRNTLNVLLCSIITTLDEIEDAAPRTAVMLACDLSLDRYLFVERVMVAGGLVDVTSDTVAITPKGREIAKKVREHAAQA